MITIEQVVYIIPILGLTASIFYYAMVIRNQNKTRENQLIMQIFQEFKSENRWRDFQEHKKMEWIDYDDFHNKYGRNNPDTYPRILSMRWTLGNIGRMVIDGMIDMQRVFDWMSPLIIDEWNLWKEIILEERIRLNDPRISVDFEYIGEEMIKLQAQYVLYHKGV